MLSVYVGTDKDASRKAVHKEAGDHAIRLTDAHSLDDIQAALRSGGMFGGAQTIIFDGVFCNEDLRAVVWSALAHMCTSSDSFYLIEEKLDAATVRTLEKHAAKVQKNDVPKQAKQASSIFDLANALKRGDKKSLWVGLQREQVNGAAAEAVHGILFWGAKDFLLKSRMGTPEYARARRLVATLAELPHDARRNGEELSYALERFALSKM